MFERPLDGRINRGFTAPPGEYDVYVALTEKPSATMPRPRTVVVKQAVTIPELDSHFELSRLCVPGKVEHESSNSSP